MTELAEHLLVNIDAWRSIVEATGPAIASFDEAVEVFRDCADQADVQRVVQAMLAGEPSTVAILARAEKAACDAADAMRANAEGLKRYRRAVIKARRGTHGPASN